jgi:uncharacterized membrane protein YsdA (DUF1294 family)
MIKPGVIFGFFQLGISLAVMGVAGLYFQYPQLYGYLAGINLSTFITMGTDKLQARRNGLRVPESNFFIAALIGGVAGLYAGIWVFRHKTQKAKFIFYLILITFLQMLLLAYFSENIAGLF